MPSEEKEKEIGETAPGEGRRRRGEGGFSPVIKGLPPPICGGRSGLVDVRIGRRPKPAAASNPSIYGHPIPRALSNIWEKVCAFLAFIHRWWPAEGGAYEVETI